jgi:hypothetical protein
MTILRLADLDDDFDLIVMRLPRMQLLEKASAALSFRQFPGQAAFAAHAVPCAACPL